MKNKRLIPIIVSLILAMVVGLGGCATPEPTPTPTPAPATKINTIDGACDAVEVHLLSLVKTPEAHRVLAIYREVRWGIHSCVLVEDYTRHYKRVMSEEDYEDWDVKRYIVQHIFDDAIFDRKTYPDAEVLAQILEISGCWSDCNPRNETLYTVSWTVDRQTGTVTPDDGNALRVGAELMKGTSTPTPAPPSPFVTADTPTGLSTGEVNQTLTYRTSANSNIAGSPEYRFDWGDGSYSSWSSSPSASHSWSSPGTYSVRAQARHPGIASEWSSGTPVVISGQASLPISASVNLIPYSKIDKPFDYAEYPSATTGCIHASSATSLAEGQTITLTLESDCPINYYNPNSNNPKPEICIIFARMERVGITSLGPRTATFFNDGKAAQIVIKVEDSSLYRLIAYNHDPHSSHYLNYSITKGVASPPPGWTPSPPSLITLPRSPNNPEIMKFYITPDDPEVKAAMNNILSGEWRWAYNDFNALREWVSTHVSYQSDQAVHGARDYWQLPAETLKLGTGDCEDFAILLCTLLRAYGVPADQVYVAIGFTEDKSCGHGYLVEKWYRGIWRVIEPEWGTLSGLFLMDWLTSTLFEEQYCFNDEDYFKGAPSLPAGVYEFEVDYSLYPLTRGAFIEFEQHLNAGEKVIGSVEWLADRAWAKESYRIVWDWSLYIYAPDGSTAFTWSGTDLEHDFSFKPAASGTYKIEILKRDYLARCARLTIDPLDWQ